MAEASKTPDKEPAQRPMSDEERADMFRKELESPIDQDEARRAFAEIEVQLAQLAVQRIRAVEQVTNAQQAVNRIDEQIGLAQLERQIIYRRTLNVADGAAVDSPEDSE